NIKLRKGLSKAESKSFNLSHPNDYMNVLADTSLGPTLASSHLEAASAIAPATASATAPAIDYATRTAPSIYNGRTEQSDTQVQTIKTVNVTDKFELTGEGYTFTIKLIHVDRTNEVLAKKLARQEAKRLEMERQQKETQDKLDKVKAEQSRL